MCKLKETILGPFPDNNKKQKKDSLASLAVKSESAQPKINFGINYLSQRGEIGGSRSLANLLSSQLSAGA